MNRRGFVGLLWFGLIGLPLLARREEIPMGTRIVQGTVGGSARKEFIYGVATADIKKDHLGFVQTYGECKVACR